MILLSYIYFPPLSLAPYVAIVESTTTLNNAVQPANAVKQPITGTSYYQGVYISPESIKAVLAAEFSTYGIENQLAKAESVISCESGFEVNPKPNGISWGVAQFTKSTWQDFGIGDIMNPYMQIKVMATLWQMSEQWRWNCYK